MGKIFLLMIISLLGITSHFVGHAESMENAPENHSFANARDVSKWLSSEFTYQWEMPDRWQSPAETINLRKGDCEDFALLSQTLLDEVGIRCEIAIIKFERLNVSHAVCIWQEKDNVNFMSNSDLVETKASSIEEAIEKNFPDWERVIFTNTERKNDKVLKRAKQNAQ